MEHFEVIVVGGGHAGCEAALAASRLGVRTGLITTSLNTIAQMSCNPAIGGTAKGHLVKEIDALGGEMAKTIDCSTLQFRMLNKSKGAAIWSSRSQADMELYAQTMRHTIERQENLYLRQDMVYELMIQEGRVRGVKTPIFGDIFAPYVILTTGTFLGGKVHIGATCYDSGRNSEKSSQALSRFLKTTNLRLGRLKTGTPPRLHKNTIDYQNLTEQHSDEQIIPFSFSHTKLPSSPLIPMHITHTTEKSHEIIKKNLKTSALYSGQIEAIGPRYCPSIEDKIVKFPQRSQHQIFLEPTGRNTMEVYPNGISTSLPLKVQRELIRSIPGLEHSDIIKAGYAIEYDFIDPTQLSSSLECQSISGLFLAGQINGTTGYEEAAAQGLMAGINASRAVKQEAPIILSRHQAYIGVLIDDLITKGTSEPYRMFTSRAENRLYLREDNADSRLTPLGREIGLVSHEDFERFTAKQKLIQEGEELVKKLSLKDLKGVPDHYLSSKDHPTTRLREILKRPQSSLVELKKHNKDLLAPFPTTLLQRLETDITYEGYIQRQNLESHRYRDLEKVKIPRGFCYENLGGLSTEVKEKLSKQAPENLFQASRMSGITPAAIQQLHIILGRKKVPQPKPQSEKIAPA